MVCNLGMIMRIISTFIWRREYVICNYVFDILKRSIFILLPGYKPLLCFTIQYGGHVVVLRHCKSTTNIVSRSLGRLPE